MHGRLKVKTTAEKEAEKEREREEKKTLYLVGLNAVLKKREEKVHDKEGLKISAQLLTANPDALTLWNIRRESLLALKGDDEEAWRGLLLEDLKTTEYCLSQNPKSYGAWHHRDWLFRVMPSPPFDEEIQLCDRYLRMDERNFHCWDHRRSIVAMSDIRGPKEELEYTEKLIDTNFSNFSAWHYRSKLLPIVFPPDQSTQLPVPEDVFIKELKRVITAVFTDPADQSPWFFLRWLLSPAPRTPRLLQVGSIPINGEQNLVLIFDRQTSEPADGLHVTINDELLQLDTLRQYLPFDKHIWIYPIKADEECIHVYLEGEFIEKEGMKITFNNSSPSFHWVTDDPLRKNDLSKKCREALQDIIDNCQTLDELDPGNKWVLLTLVNAMEMTDIRKYESEILKYLSQLECLDPLRKNYYRDTRSRVLILSKVEEALRFKSKQLDLSNINLTCISHANYFSFFEEIDLSNNCIRSLIPVGLFINCRHLILDGTLNLNLKPLRLLPLVKNLSIKSCNIKSTEELNELISCSVKPLENLCIKDNDSLDVDEIKRILPHIKNIVL